MAIERKGAGSSPLAWFLLLAAVAMAAGGVQSLDLSGPRGGTVASTPCPPGEDPDKTVRVFKANKLGDVELRCRKWRHIQSGHPPINAQTYRCIARVLAEAVPVKTQGQWRYQLRFRGGDWAMVWVQPGPPGGSTINTAYTKGAKAASARWADCVKGTVV